MLNQIVYIRLSAVVVFLTLSLFCDAQEVIVVDDRLPREEKTALVILNGFGDSKKNRKVQTDFFTTLNCDVYIPEFILRHSLEDSHDTFSQFYKEHQLDEYADVKVVCYIIGGYVLNKHIEKEGFGKISTIIYDRSPIQERAPKVAVEWICLLSKMVYGDVLVQFSKVEISPLESTPGVEIGLIIENKATSIMRLFRKTASKYGAYNFNPSEMDGNVDDYFHSVLDHDEMYVRFDVVGDEIKHFLEHGEFTKDARRKRYEWDPFEKRQP